MNNPLNTNELQFWLKFNSLGHTNWYEIAEPIGFDGAKFVVDQEPNRFARSIKYGAIDKLRFVNTFEGLATTIQTINPQGDQSDNLDYGLQWLLYIFNKYGFELNVDFKITVNGVDFKIYGLDANDKEVTDGYTYFQCKLIDNSNVMDYKRRYDDKLNMFADKGVFGQTIAPLQTFNYLKRSVAIQEESIFELTQNEIINTSVLIPFANPIKNYTKFGITDTLTFMSTYPVDPTSALLSYSYIKARNTKTNLRITFDLNYYTPSATQLVLKILVGVNNVSISHDITIQLPVGTGTNNVYQNTVTIPFVFTGERVAVYFRRNSGFTFGGGSKITLNATANPLDNVIKAVRLVDLYKQSNLMFRNLPFYAPLLDVGGKYHNQAVFNKSTVSQRVDNMYTTFKDLTENLMECCQDVELLENEMFIDEYDKFYTNDEIGVYNQVPSNELAIDVNERFAANRLDFIYSKYAQDRQLTGTNESVHTDSQNRVQNDKVENKKEIKIDFVRDPLEQQNIINLEISKPSTSTDNDDTLCLEEMTQLAPNSSGVITGAFTVRVNGSNVEILNRDFNDPSTETEVNWTRYGINNGQNVSIVGVLTGNYTVVSTTISILTLTPQFSYSIPDGTYFIALNHPYTNVLWQTRTNQGFSLINGVSDKFGNLNFTIKRNFMRWFKYIASFVQYNQKDIINTYFKNNGALQTQLTTESTPVTEDANILFSQLPTPILTGKIINLTVASDWQDEIDYLNKYELPNTTGVGSLRRKGFVRCLDLKGNVILGYVQNRSFNVSTNELNLTLEEKYSPQILKVDVIGSDLFVNDVRYNLSGNANWFQTQNNFIQFFDDQSRSICNLYEYNFVSLNNVTYNSIGNLVTALNALI
jgi:hypothetical protein